MGYAQTRPAILRSLVENTGIMMWRSDIAEETGLSEKSVLSAMGALMRTGQHNITVNARGHAWTYNGPAKPETRENTPAERKSNAKPPFEVDVVSAYPTAIMGRAKQLVADAERATYKTRTFKEVTGVYSTDSKAVIITDENGNLYRATRL